MSPLALAVVAALGLLAAIALWAARRIRARSPGKWASAGGVVVDAEGCVALIRERRSEEHTSELQSRFDLVCRLLLEKKKVHLNIHHEDDTGIEITCNILLFNMNFSSTSLNISFNNTL